ADPDPEMTCLAGEYEPVKKKGMEKFLHWDGTGQLYDFGKTEKYGWLCTSGVPLKDSQGKIYAFVLADVSMAGVFADVGHFTIRYFIVMILVTLLLALYLTHRVEKQVIVPIVRLTKGVEDLTADRQGGCETTGWFANTGIRTGDQIERLNLALEDLENTLNKTEEKDGLREDLT
ncbi:MAG: hypothetical protein K6F53_01510, partial [Lachnospiraceae bacterium]|nr:hypothetical protein [Lachnospiraceae bacterium]